MNFKLSTLNFAFVVTALATVAAARPDRASPKPLIEAVAEASDPVAIARAASRLSGRQLEEMIGSSRAATRAVVFAAPFNDEAVAMLSRLSDVAGGYDRSLAVPASRAAREIAGNLESTEISAREIPRRDLAEATVSWHRIARDRSLWADVRVAALETARDLTRLLTGDGSKPVIELVADPDPEVRRAALELLESPLRPAAYPRVVSRLIEDEVDEVALAAAAALCSGALFGDDMAPVLEAAGESGLERIAALAGDRKLSAAARFAAAGCLEGDARSAIARNLPAELRRQLERSR